ncbi:MAG: hypothetical protein QXM52_01690 [Candidatus Bathyarchaeia archaeon]
MVSQKTMKALIKPKHKRKTRMNESRSHLERLHEEFAKFERTMEELHFLKLVAQDLRSFRKMIRLRKYD